MIRKGSPMGWAIWGKWGPVMIIKGWRLEWAAQGEEGGPVMIRKVMGSDPRGGTPRVMISKGWPLG